MWLKTGWGGRVQRFLQCWASWHKLNGYLTCQVASQLMSHTLMQQRQWRRKMDVAVSRTLFFGCCLTDESNVSVCCVEDKVKADEQPTVRLQSAVIQERKNTIWHNQGLQKTKTRGRLSKKENVIFDFSPKNPLLLSLEVFYELRRWNVSQTTQSQFKDSLLFERVFLKFLQKPNVCNRWFFTALAWTFFFLARISEV